MRYSVKQLNKQLTKTQSNIVASDIYPQYLRAGAGTGKTEVLVQKIIHILKNDPAVDLSNFAIITFTNKATDEMQKRIADMLYKCWLNEDNDSLRKSLDIVNMADICTIHSFCENLLREFGIHIGIAPNFKIKSFSKESSDIINDVVAMNHDDMLLYEISSFSISRLLSILLRDNGNRGIRMTDAMISELKKPAENSPFWNKFKALYLDMYMQCFNRIEDAKAESNILTPNDLIRHAADLLGNEVIAKRICSKYRYVFIDEFQDTNKDQFDLVQKFIDNGVEVFLVGDDKQSIYAFRGADVQNSMEMHDFIKEINRKSDKFYLDENFRSTRSVIDKINDIFSGKFQYDGHLLSFPTEPLKVPTSIPDDEQTEPLKVFYEKSIVDTVEEILSSTTVNGRKATYGDIAILCRRNFDIDRLSEELKAKNIPTFIVGGKGFYRSKSVVDTYKFFNAAVCRDESSINELLFTDYYKAVANSDNGVDFRSFISEVSDILHIKTVEDSLIYLYEKSNVFEYYRAKNDYQSVSNLLKLKDIARSLIDKDNIQPLQFVEYLNIMISTHQDEDEADVPETERTAGVVTLYSIHKAKGLSFPIVIIPCCDNKLNRPITRPKIIFDSQSEHSAIAFDSEALSDLLPIDNEYVRMFDDNVIKQLEEEIRVFYVACTRAEKQIILLNNSSKSRVMQTLNFREYASVSKWLLEMDKR